MQILRAIMIGDVVGDPGLQVLDHRLPHLIKELSADFVIVNGENAASGFGLTGPVLEKLFAAGADVVTGGNHIWEKREFWPVLDEEKRVLRPMNYPSGKLPAGILPAGTPRRDSEDAKPCSASPGRGWIKLEKPSPHDGTPVIWLVVNLQGREFMTPLDCPFRTFDAFEAGLGDIITRIEPLLDTEGKLPEHLKDRLVILVDFHAESAREKESLAYYLDGRVSAVAGTHTHVQTADERILPKGTAYITDLGMCGTLDGIIGMDPKICLDRARNQVLYRMEVAAPETGGRTAVQGIIVEIDEESGKAVSIKRLSV